VSNPQKTSQANKEVTCAHHLMYI